MKTVKITLEGGVIQDIDVPSGVKVVVYDFDTDGVPEEDLRRAPSGEMCVQTTWWHAL
jgi:hypothetical protein